MPLVDLLKRLGVRKEPAVKCCLCPFANSTGPVDQRSRIPSEQRGDGAFASSASRARVPHRTQQNARIDWINSLSWIG